MPLNEAKPRRPRTLQERVTPIVDRARALEQRFGRRPALVSILLFKWDGGARGRGTPRLVERKPLTPSPTVKGEGTLRVRGFSGGHSQEGTVRLIEISPRYVEADLDPLFRELPEDEDVVIEVVHDGRDGPNPRRDAYVPISRPERDLDSFDWSVTINRLEDAHTRRAWCECSP